MNVALGGERVGSGNKMNIHLRHYERSTHNLSQQYKTSAGIGILYPCLCIPALRGDKFDISISAGVRTVPSKGAMFGSYKLQIDYYFCPIRLYTGILHNNPYNLGMNMPKVYFPQFTAKAVVQSGGVHKLKFSTSSLLHYLGLSGMGNGNGVGTFKRTFNATPILAYYDIFKNYYSNKQEGRAYVLSNDALQEQTFYDASYTENGGEGDTHNVRVGNDGNNQYFIIPANNFPIFTIHGYGLDEYNIHYQIYNANNEPVEYANGTIGDALENDIFTSDTITSTEIICYVADEFEEGYTIKFWMPNSALPYPDGNLNLQPFDLSNIDEMRAELLSWHTMGAAYDINQFDKYPYKAVAKKTVSGASDGNQNPLNGLMIKTYQSDIFNNWLSSEFIDGVNGIANITKVNTEGGGFTIDALNFSEKMYKLLNRIVVSGNTYEDWQNVVYEDTPKKHLESPMYLGGESQEIVFEEIVATAVGSDTTLGSMGGRGLSRHRRGGHIRAKIDEAGFIIGIMSITPRVDYSQGNEFYFTDVFTMDDFHKPALDGIGFQDLIGERMAYFDTNVNTNGEILRHSIGKLPAWIEYMTAVDKVHGDLADGENSFMVLNRNYEFDEDGRCIKDATTYVEPNKFNDTFYYTERDAQNFWVQINHQITARRKMSAKQIPNI